MGKFLRASYCQVRLRSAAWSRRECGMRERNQGDDGREWSYPGRRHELRQKSVGRAAVLPGRRRRSFAAARLRSACGARLQGHRQRPRSLPGPKLVRTQSGTGSMVL